MDKFNAWRVTADLKRKIVALNWFVAGILIGAWLVMAFMTGMCA